MRVEIVRVAGVALDAQAMLHRHPGDRERTARWVAANLRAIRHGRIPWHWRLAMRAFGVPSVA